MKSIKVSIAPLYRAYQENYVSKVEMSLEFDNEAKALNFVRDLNMLIITFNNSDKE